MTAQGAAQATRIEVQTSALLRLLGDAKAFAGHDDTLPMINGVSFEFAGEDMLAVATDRYTLGASRLAVGKTIVQPIRMLRLAEVERIEKAFRPAKGADPTLALEFGDESLSVETTATLDGQPTHREAFPWSEYKPVPWRSILDGVRGVESGPVLGAFNPEFLAKFVAVQHDKSQPVIVWPTAPNKPWRVTVSDHFTGLIMPARTPSEAEWIPAPMNVPVEPKRRAPRTSKKAAA